MNKENEAREILQQIKLGNFYLLLHAKTRITERKIMPEQIINCAETCFYSEWQRDHQTHLFLGNFTRDHTGGFTAIVDENVLVVTVFKRRFSKWEQELQKKLKH